MHLAYVRMYDAPISEAQPEDVVGIDTQRPHGTQHHHVANVKFHHSHILSVEQHWVLNVLTHNLEKKTHATV